MFKKIFSIENQDVHKVVTVMGVRFKVKSLKLVLRRDIKNLETNQKRLKRQLNYYKSSLENIGQNSSDFVECASDNIEVQDPTKLIAFYLPQFHTFKENEEWHGKGFTEWTNVTKAKPMYEGHFQPQLPIDVGFYDLSCDKVMYRQVELAKQYGIHGFCFHYYWFSGKRLMEQPIFNWLNNKELDLPFCLCWANENWSKRWDGGNNEVLMEQTLKEDDWKKFVEDIVPFLQDERYIKINNKPVLIIYRPALFEYDMYLNFVDNIRAEVKNYGIDDLYLIMARTFGEVNPPKYYHMDATVEFPPHCMPNKRRKKNIGYVDPNFKGQIFDMDYYINNERYIYDVDYPLFKTVFPNWDNSARRQDTASILPMSLVLYKKWLSGCLKWTKEHNEKERQIIFVNAWNEWAEGAHLEPDRKNGYAYLQATREVLESENVEEVN